MVTTSNYELNEVLSTINEGIQASIKGVESLASLETSTSKQESRILCDLLDSIRPVVKYIDQEYLIHSDGANDPFDSRGEDRYYPERVIEVIKNHGFVRVSNDIADGEDYTGDALLLTRSLGLVHVEFEGGASGYSSGGWGYTGTPAKMTRLQAVEYFGFGAICKGIADVLNKALEKMDKRKAALQKRLDVIQRMTL